MATLGQGKKFLGLIEEKSDDDLQKLLGSGLLTDLLDCPNPDLVDREAFQKVLAMVVPKQESLLAFAGTVSISARTGKFIARGNFIVDTGKKAKVKISYLGDTFKKNFLDKMEEPIGEIKLRYHKLRRSCSVNDLILAELGGKEKAETTLTEMFALMELQPNGENGTLLTNCYANIFYIRDINGVLRAVGCRWYDGGWVVRAFYVEGPPVWDGTSQVFSRRNSSETKN